MKRNVLAKRAIGLESFTVNQKLKLPGTLTVPIVPEIMPDGDKISPAGNAPEVSVHVYGGTPPVRTVMLASDAEYAWPTLAFGSVTGDIIVNVPGVQFIVIVRVELTAPDVMAAVNVPVSANVVELYVTGSAVDAAVAVHDELNPFVALAKEIGAAVF